jgi:hypothetical protein
LSVVSEVQISARVRQIAQARIAAVQPPRTDEYDVLFRKRKRGVRFDTLRSGSKAGTDLARKPKNLGVSTRPGDGWTSGQMQVLKTLVCEAAEPHGRHIDLAKRCSSRSSRASGVRRRGARSFRST